jgi:hypothetical protein
MRKCGLLQVGVGLLDGRAMVVGRVDRDRAGVEDVGFSGAEVGVETPPVEQGVSSGSVVPASWVS